MLLTILFGFLLSAVSFSILIVADPTSVIIINKVTVTENDCGYFEPCSVEIIPTKKNSQLTVNIAVKKLIPPEMMMSMLLDLGGPSPISHNLTLCNALTDKKIGQSFVKAGLPKDSFPKRCPINPGPWVVSKWEVPAELVPTGFPDTTASGVVIIGLDGQDFCIRLDVEGQLKHVVPSFGR